MKNDHISEVKGIVILALGLILLASLVSFVPTDLSWYTSQPNLPAQNWVRICGAYAAGVLFFCFGKSSYLIILFMLFWSWNRLTNRVIRFSIAKLTSFLVLLCVASAILSLTTVNREPQHFQSAGIIGLIFSDFLGRYFGVLGAYIILFALGALALVLTGEFLLTPLFLKISEASNELLSLGWKKILSLRDTEQTVKQKNVDGRRAQEIKQMVERAEKKSRPEPEKLEGPKSFTALKDKAETMDSKDVEKKEFSAKPSIRIVEPKEQAKEHVSIEPKTVGTYHLPSLDLLTDPPQISTSRIQDSLVNGAKTLETTLASFGVSVRVADIERGPVITRYELEPAPGVKVQKITTLSDDIALAMRAPSVRIVAPIPGKNRVGIEVPNGASASVYLKDVLTQSEFRTSGSKLMLALGKDISGKSLISDLAEMPHLLIAGTTGSGKTVALNSIIMSILFNASPSEVKFLMVDPKMVELIAYNDLPHLLCPVITDSKKVSGALNWVVSEMEHRYKILAKAGVRNIKSYHQQGNTMPYIVIVVDELADLMQVSAKTIESAITRLAQLARAVGIHLILATQRPSVDVITGVIKANFPARVSFKVASKVDSRTVLDMNGAENLLGKGDLLFMKPGDAKPTRGQCSYVSDEEIRKVIDFIKPQQIPEYNDSITTQQPTGGAPNGAQEDEMYDEAVRVVIETNQASVSILQRRLR
ncbi:MAG: DNA translocase FtsK, partial [Candidatus Omnitrophica bacterium]|nr:DNA translocase FtsK [Candidatus Omnitrophota bacterium]